jgi:serine/threonine protein kinase/formylglycine-generating enzyme required for sulfatase activity
MEEKIPGFDLIRLLGISGPNVVFLARQQFMNRLVAVKTVQLAENSADRQQMLHREAEIVGSLVQPNILPLFDFVELDGRGFAVYEFMEGGSLRERIGKGRIDVDEVVRMMEQVARALEFAHQHGITHADLKPDNILLSSDDQPKVADFGIAIDERQPSLPSADPVLRGTPRYMAPEQIQRGDSRLGPAIDIHAFGIVLYELLTGRPPYLAASTPDTFEQICLHAPVPPTRINKAVPRDLETICLRCLAKNPSARYPSAEAVAEDLRRFQSGQPIRGRRVLAWERLKLWIKRNPAIFGLWMASMFVIAFTLYSFSVQYLATMKALEFATHNESRRHAEWVASLQNASEDLVPLIVTSAADDWKSLSPLIRSGLQNSDLAPKDRTRFQLALLHEQPELLADLSSRAMMAEPKEFFMIVNTIEKRKATIPRDLWQKHLLELSSVRVRSSEDLPVAFRKWIAWVFYRGSVRIDERQCRLMVTELLKSNPIHLSTWIRMLGPNTDQFVVPLVDAYSEASRPLEHRRLAAWLLARFASHDPQRLIQSMLSADEHDFLSFLAPLEKHEKVAIDLLCAVLRRKPSGGERAPREFDCEKRTNAALALCKLGEFEPVWPLLQHTVDPSLRSNLIHRFRSAEIDLQVFIDRLRVETDVTVRRALWLVLGEYPADGLTQSEIESLIEFAQSSFRTDPDAGIHSACEWFLKQWRTELPSVGTSDASIGDAISGHRDWFINSQLQSFVVARGPVDVLMGSPDDEPRRQSWETITTCRIERSFAIAMKEVTAEQYQRFLPDGGQVSNPAFGPQLPARFVKYLDAIRYCRWLSEQEGIAEEEMCYPPLEEIKDGMIPYANYLSRTGYRLPSEAELEYSIRAGASTQFGFGDFKKLLPKYAWYFRNSNNRPSMVGVLKPNDLGLFDSLGNVFEWGQEYSKHNFVDDKFRNRRKVDVEDLTPIVAANRTRIVKGGAFQEHEDSLRCAFRESLPVIGKTYNTGIRLARTLPNSKPSSANKASNADIE